MGEASLGANFLGGGCTTLQKSSFLLLLPQPPFANLTFHCSSSSWQKTRKDAVLQHFHLTPSTNKTSWRKKNSNAKAQKKFEDANTKVAGKWSLARKKSSKSFFLPMPINKMLASSAEKFLDSPRLGPREGAEM